MGRAATVRLLAVIAFAGLAAAAPPPAADAAASADDGPLAIVALDGIPYGVAEQAHHDGLFRDFYPPGRMIAPFPSLTTVSFCEMLAPLGAAAPRGYELRYFDPAKERLEGGGLFDYDDDPAPWKPLFDYNQSSLVFKTLAYFSPSRGARRELSDIAAQLAAFDGRLYLGYIGATDALVHTGGPEAGRRFLERLDRSLGWMKGARARAGLPPLRLLLLSDHGCEFAFPDGAEMAGVHVQDAIHAAGLDVKDDLDRPDAVAYPLFGLVGFTSLYLPRAMDDLARERLVDALAAEPGVELVMTDEGDHIRVRAGVEQAAIAFDPATDRYRYAAGVGDPLGYLPLEAKLGREGSLSDEGFAADCAWFQHTRLAHFPDALRRIVESFHTVVRVPAPITISYRDHFHSARALASAGLAVIRKDFLGTHGNLAAASTYGLVMTNFEPAPDAVRGSDVLQTFVPGALLEAERIRRGHQSLQSTAARTP